MSISIRSVGLSLVGACYSADANDPTAEGDVAGVSARLAANLTVGGYDCSNNDVNPLASIVSDHDFAVNERCFAYGECDRVAAFTRANKSVLHIEYGPVATLARTVCPRALALRFYTILAAADRLDGNYTRCP